MKFTAKRLLSAGIIGIAAIVTPIALTVGLPEVGGGPASTAFAANGACTPNGTYDEICYNQSTSSPLDSYQYVPVSGTPLTTQAATISGNCASPTVAAPAILSVCGFVYSGGYAGTPKAASLGTNGQATGVGAVSPAWTIDNKQSGSKLQAEAIDFSPGPAAVVSNRPFNDAQIPIQRKDTGVAQNPSVLVQLAELDSTGTVLATQNCTIAGNTGTQITADTDGPGIGGSCGPSMPAAGGGFVPTPSAFNKVEVRDLTVSTSISVVNTSTFTLQNQVCAGGQIIPTSGPVGATLLDKAAAGCKSYSVFDSTGDANGQNQLLTFGGGTGSLPMTLTITWAPQSPACQPDDTGPLPQCVVHQVAFNGDDFTDQVYCAPADPNTLSGNTLCTTDKKYSFVAVPATSVGSLSDGTTISSLTTNPLYVASTSGLPPAGRVSVMTTSGPAVLDYSATTATTLIVTTVVSGTGTWKVSTGDAVDQIETQVTEDWIGNVDCCRVR